MKAAVHLAQCLPCATQGMLAAIYHSSKGSANYPLILSATVTLPARSCGPAASYIFLNVKNVLCFNCKEQNLVTKGNIPCLFIDSQVREQKQLWS